MTDQSRNPHRRWAASVLTTTSNELIGMEETVRLCIVAYCAGGHVLLEGNPGLGKTSLVKGLARAIGLQEGRIQFTPDLMPADITGTFMPSYADGKQQSWAFEPGPIFASLLLADEINRATPKTQSALLEAMAEAQVTVLGQTYRLPTPFVVMATQNPLDHSGTYALPEAQADRFMFKLIMPVPAGDAVRTIIRSKRALPPADKARPAVSSPQLSPRRTLFARYNTPTPPAAGSDEEAALMASYDQARIAFSARAREVEYARVQPGLEQHLVTMFLASNARFAELERDGILAGDQLARARALAATLTYGLGPRAVLNLDKAARAWALCFGTTLTAEDAPTADAIDLAHVLIPILRHRLKTSFTWETEYRELAARSPFAQADDLMAAFIADFALSTAPAGRRKVGNEWLDFGNYRDLLRAELEQVLGLGGRRR